MISVIELFDRRACTKRQKSHVDIYIERNNSLEHKLYIHLYTNIYIHLTRKMELRASTWDWPWRHPTPRTLSVELGPSSGVECVLYRFVLVFRLFTEN